jgi:hypothetical protein
VTHCVPACSFLQYHMWCGAAPGAYGAEETFDLTGDPWEMHNSIHNTGGANFSAVNGPLAQFLFSCSGPECNSPQPATVKEFPCYQPTGPRHEFDP